jgi:hypothetical protein
VQHVGAPAGQQALETREEPPVERGADRQQRDLDPRLAEPLGEPAPPQQHRVNVVAPLAQDAAELDHHPLGASRTSALDGLDDSQAAAPASRYTSSQPSTVRSTA